MAQRIKQTKDDAPVVQVEQPARSAADDAPVVQVDRPAETAADDAPAIQVQGIAPFNRKGWRGGHINYECAFCAYSTLEPRRMSNHLRTAHGISGGAIPTDGNPPVVLISDDEVK